VSDSTSHPRRWPRLSGGGEGVLWRGVQTPQFSHRTSVSQSLPSSSGRDLHEADRESRAV